MGQAYPPLIPNPASRHKTPASVQVELHYAKLGVIARWDWLRYCRLARFLGLTVYELGSHLCTSHKTIDAAKEHNRFPGAVCLLLTMLEAQVMHKFTDDVIKDPFLTHGPPQGS